MSAHLAALERRVAALEVAGLGLAPSDDVGIANAQFIGPTGAVEAPPAGNVTSAEPVTISGVMYPPLTSGRVPVANGLGRAQWGQIGSSSIAPGSIDESSYGVQSIPQSAMKPKLGEAGSASVKGENIDYETIEQANMAAASVGAEQLIPLCVATGSIIARAVNSGKVLPAAGGKKATKGKVSEGLTETSRGVARTINGSLTGGTAGEAIRKWVVKHKLATSFVNVTIYANNAGGPGEILPYEVLKVKVVILNAEELELVWPEVTPENATFWFTIWSA